MGTRPSARSSKSGVRAVNEDRSIGLPHVTDILARAGLVDTSWFGDYARDLGSAVHAATHLLDDGDLDWASVAGPVLPRLRQYQKFKDEVKPEILASEQKVESLALGYQGRYDRRVRINGREGILDIKGPSRGPWQALQVAMYAGAVNSLGQPPLARWTLHLSDDRYQLIEHKDRDDWRVAMAAITIAAWRLKHGC